MINGSLKPLGIKRYSLKILETIKNNISYYGTGFGIYAGMIQFYSRQEELIKKHKQREKALLDNQKQKEEELKNSYRPTFFLEKNNIILKMEK